METKLDLILEWSLHCVAQAHSPPTSASCVPESMGTYYHTQLRFCLMKMSTGMYKFTYINIPT